MKRMALIHPLVLVAATVWLVGCGGTSTQKAPNGSATIGGTINGLPAGSTVLLVDNTADTISINENGNFSFDKSMMAETPYNVTVFGAPTGASCAVANGSGTVDQNADAVTNVTVTCQNAAVAMNNYYVGVTVSGISSGSSVIFALNGANSLAVNTNGLAVFSQPLATEEEGPEGPGSYNVTVTTNPVGQTCTLSNASGVITNTNFTDFVNVTVVCK